MKMFNKHWIWSFKWENRQFLDCKKFFKPVKTKIIYKKSSNHTIFPIEWPLNSLENAVNENVKKWEKNFWLKSAKKIEIN